MSTTVALTSQSPLDLQALVDTTQLSITLLNPWITQTPQSDNAVVSAVTKQAARYADAIQLTVAAAQSGFTVTKDVLYLARVLDDPKTKKKDVSDYSAGTLILAMESKEKATTALNALRDIRKELMKIQRDLVLEENNVDLQQNGVGLRLRSELDNDLKALNAFFDQVSLFVKWWDWVQTETSPLREKQPMEYQLDALRDSATVARWKEMEEKFMSYTRMISIMRTQHADFFRLPSTEVKKQSSAEVGMVYTSQPHPGVIAKVISWIWDLMN